jgi:hypothetical protein
MKMAALNGLTLTAESLLDLPDDMPSSESDLPSRAPKDERVCRLPANFTLEGKYFVL